MEKEYKVGTVGFLYKDEAIPPGLPVKKLEIINKDKTIKFPKEDVDRLYREGYLVLIESSRPKPKFDIGDFVQVQQITGESQINYSNSYLKEYLGKHYDVFTKGIIRERKFIKERQEWIYSVCGVSTPDIGSDDIRVVKTYGDIDGYLRECDLIKTDDLEFVLSFNLLDPGDNIIEIKISKE